MLRELDLGKEGIRFVRDRLSKGKTLSKCLLNLPLTEGGVFTWVPDSVGEDRARDFEHGGIITSAEEGRTRDERLVRLISHHLAGPGSPYAIFEHASARPTDPWLSSSPELRFTFEGEVYLFVTSQERADASAILRTMRKASSWLSNGVLTALPNMEKIETGQAVTSEHMKSLAAKAERILVGAYDFEGYLVWGKR